METTGAKRRRVDKQGPPDDVTQRSDVADQAHPDRVALMSLPPELIERATDFLDDVSFCHARSAHRRFAVRANEHVLAGRARAHWLRHTLRDVCQYGPHDAVVAHLNVGTETVTSAHLIEAARHDNAPAIEAICRHFDLDGSEYSTSFADAAGSLGSTRALEMLVRFGFRASRDALYGAAFYGRRPRWGALKALHRLDLGDWGPWLMDEAARKGRCKLVRFLHERLGQACTPDAMDAAAMQGHLKVIEFLHNNRTEGCTTYAMDWAAQNGHLNIVRFLHRNRTEGCTTNAMDQAAAHGHIEVVEFLHDHRSEGCTSAAMDRAAAGGHMGVVVFLAENRTEGNPTTAKQSAAEMRQADVLAYLRRRWPSPSRQRKRQRIVSVQTTVET